MNAPRRSPRRRVDGVLLLDKPAGMTSNAALQRVRRIYAAAKAGHTGTLDPMATGLLPLCFGEATKFSSHMLDADKTYVAELTLGVTTDTADAEGRELLRRPVNIGRSDFEAVLQRFIGDIEQVPPMYSALKRNGRPLYEYARQGIELERSPRQVTIHALTLVEFKAPHAVIEVTCSKGTYVRTLGADIGEMLGCGAHLSALRRTRIGHLELLEAHTIDSLEALGASQRDVLLAPVDSLLSGFPEKVLDAGQGKRFMQGQPVALSDLAAGRCRTYGPDREFLGLGEGRSDGQFHPCRLVGSVAESPENS